MRQVAAVRPGSSHASRLGHGVAVLGQVAQGAAQLRRLDGLVQQRISARGGLAQTIRGRVSGDHQCGYAAFGPGMECLDGVATGHVAGEAIIHHQ